MVQARTGAAATAVGTTLKLDYQYCVFELDCSISVFRKASDRRRLKKVRTNAEMQLPGTTAELTNCSCHDSPGVAAPIGMGTRTHLNIQQPTQHTESIE
jgi:hypothetical protein